MRTEISFCVVNTQDSDSSNVLNGEVTPTYEPHAQLFHKFVHSINSIIPQLTRSSDHCKDVKAVKHSPLPPHTPNYKRLGFQSSRLAGTICLLEFPHESTHSATKSSAFQSERAAQVNADTSVVLFGSCLSPVVTEKLRRN